MTRSTHHDAVTALISNVSSIKLLVRHDPPPPGLMVSIMTTSYFFQGGHWYIERSSKTFPALRVIRDTQTNKHYI
jgi:hypothetical protein